jgi:hypothetical protein
MYSAVVRQYEVSNGFIIDGMYCRHGLPQQGDIWFRIVLVLAVYSTVIYIVDMHCCSRAPYST